MNTIEISRIKIFFQVESKFVNVCFHISLIDIKRMSRNVKHGFKSNIHVNKAAQLFIYKQIKEKIQPIYKTFSIFWALICHILRVFFFFLLSHSPLDAWKRCVNVWESALFRHLRSLTDNAKMNICLTCWSSLYISLFFSLLFSLQRAYFFFFLRRLHFVYIILHYFLSSVRYLLTGIYSVAKRLTEIVWIYFTSFHFDTCKYHLDEHTLMRT